MADHLRSDLSGFRRDLLFTIPGLDHPSGRVVADEMERLFEREVSHGPRYPNPNELVETELVEKGRLDGRTNYDELATVGRELAECRWWWECKRLGIA